MKIAYLFLLTLPWLTQVVSKIQHACLITINTNDPSDKDEYQCTFDDTSAGRIPWRCHMDETRKEQCIWDVANAHFTHAPAKPYCKVANPGFQGGGTCELPLGIYCLGADVAKTKDSVVTNPVERFREECTSYFGNYTTLMKKGILIDQGNMPG